MEGTDRPAADPIGHLVEELSKLPGIGPKSAQRITFHLLRASTDETDLLARAIVSLKQRIRLCSSCYRWWIHVGTRRTSKTKFVC